MFWVPALPKGVPDLRLESKEWVPLRWSLHPQKTAPQISLKAGVYVVLILHGITFHKGRVRNWGTTEILKAVSMQNDSGLYPLCSRIWGFGAQDSY